MNATAKPIEDAQHCLSLARDQHERVELRLHQLRHDLSGLEQEMVDLKASLEEALDDPQRLQTLRDASEYGLWNELRARQPGRSRYRVVVLRSGMPRRRNGEALQRGGLCMPMLSGRGSVLRPIRSDGL